MFLDREKNLKIQNKKKRQGYSGRNNTDNDELSKR